MNCLVVGANKKPILEYADSSNFLFIDDGPLIDALDIPSRRKVTVFDVKKHHLNPLHNIDIDYRRAREFMAVMDAIFPEGDSTLTKKNANFVLLNALLDKPTYLHKLLRGDKRDAAKQDAYQKIATLLLSPVLRSVLCKPTNFSLKGIVLARLDRAVLGDFDALTLGMLLISAFDGQVVLPDGGFYLRDTHVNLIREGRLVVGVNHLSELSPKLRNEVLLIENQLGRRATYEDATTLAHYARLLPNTNEFNDFIQQAMA
jgi:hypothetical protein